MPTNDALQAIKAYLRQEPDQNLRDQAEFLLRDCETGSDLAIAEAKERFIGHLSFGTAGMRAKMEAGFRRLNRVTVAKAAFAIGTLLIERLNSQKTGPKGRIIVGHDARLQSNVFCQEIISILKGLGFSVLHFDGPVATPICAFATKHVAACAGIMVTASHNPPLDNGLKVYGANGAQIVSPDDFLIESHLKRAPDYQDLPRQKHQGGELGQLLPQEVLEAYFQNIANTQISPGAARDSLRVVYTPLHGVGLRFIKDALQQHSFVELLPVEAQKEPDGNFPTLQFPNPEEEGALDLALEYASAEKADVIIANDPDADRLAVAIPNRSGSGFTLLSGNEVGAILGCDVLENVDTEKQKLVISTLVSSRLLSAMAKVCNASYAESLTGFSRIAEIAFERETKFDEQFVFGFEEALGYCVGDFVRDKDGICAAVRVLERIALLKAQGKNIWEELDRIGLKYGLFSNLQWSFRFSGVDAQERMQSVMAKLRELKGGTQFFGQGIKSHFDLLHEGYQDFSKANVLVFFLEDGTRIVVRPSGTEPKVKFYVEKSMQVAGLQDLEMVRKNLDRDLQKYRELTASEAYSGSFSPATGLD